MKKNTLGQNMRIIHRYLGFFLAGIMAVYALSGIIMVYRNTDFLKKEVIEEKQIATHLEGSELSAQLRIRGLRVERQEGELLFFKQGTYNQSTGIAQVKKMKLPFVLDKMEKMHKATTNSPLYFLNLFFGVSLLFFVISSFWMFIPSSSVFKKGMYFTLAGIVLTLIIVFV